MPAVDFPRRVEPEWLDELAPDDPRAAHSRRDLRRINMLMTNASIVARELARGFQDGTLRTVAEIGAGDGTFMLRVARKIHCKGVRLVLLDRQDIVSRETRAEFQSLEWGVEPVAADVFEWLARPATPVFDVIVANLFLHHFDAGRLTLLLSLAAQHTRLLIACEPRRSPLGLAACRLLGLIGCNDVTRHDAEASVHAGFTHRELSGLWQDGKAWALREKASRLFSHTFVARRGK